MAQTHDVRFAVVFSALDEVASSRQSVRPNLLIFLLSSFFTLPNRHTPRRLKRNEMPQGCSLRARREIIERHRKPIRQSTRQSTLLNALPVLRGLVILVPVRC